MVEPWENPGPVPSRIAAAASKIFRMFGCLQALQIGARIQISVVRATSVDASWQRLPCRSCVPIKRSLCLSHCRMLGFVMRGLDPRIHHASQDSFKEDGWPGHLAQRRASRFCPAMTKNRENAMLLTRREVVAGCAGGLASLLISPA